MGNCKDGMLMKKEDPYRVQAEIQKQRLKKVTNEEEQAEDRVESSLPSRSIVHKNKKKKLKIPIISLLAFLFVLLPVVLLLINSLLNGKNFSNLLTTENTSGLFENVNIQKEKPTDNNQTNRVNQEQEEIVIESNSKAEEDVEGENPQEKATEESEENAKEEKSESEQTIKNAPKKEEPEEDKEKVEAEQQTSPDEKIVYHTVAKGENLYRIALKYYPNGDGVEKIKAANNMTTEQVQLGQTLKIVLEP
ncbi:LysM peptidoglycan-binding domain-containing protein [Niallia sp.]|uniref:LysM peptidoglycan-binding domain-containing protein n=1 Tax=Niallia sp. TaxID=2837523 RepID=UPI00289FC097|nr:LysM peptidoglycan-binding domain-containing protein [Niallia sp.]